MQTQINHQISIEEISKKDKKISIAIMLKSEIDFILSQMMVIEDCRMDIINNHQFLNFKFPFYENSWVKFLFLDLM